MYNKNIEREVLKMMEFLNCLVIETLEEFEKITKVYDENRYFYNNSSIKKPTSFPAFYKMSGPYYYQWDECSKDIIYNEWNCLKEKIEKKMEILKEMLDK